ncbi:MAG TPA: type II toxin-antitoxin system PemK/MazF family toxin [Candidatus Lumbricidophila sp.]|nr:type II toxin-antitoxin system PemK/MazF family toxin [Candidatus Lumbricidophila sp.]
MSLLTALLRALLSAFTSTQQRKQPTFTRPTRQGRDGSRQPAGDVLVSPGQFGDAATVEVDPRSLRAVQLGYAPQRDASPDPGEIVWTWVPYEERDGRGKDRPVVIVAADGRGGYYAVQLTSKEHDGPDSFEVGRGSWDSSGRVSYVKLDRVFRVFPEGMRREAASLDKFRYGEIADALRVRYGWSVGAR